MILISGDKWTLVADFGLEVYHKIIHSIEVDVSRLEASVIKPIVHPQNDTDKIYLDSTTQTTFALLFNQITSRITNLKHEIWEIEQNLFSQSRQKHGLINFGGAVLKFLFGTMNSEDMERINEKLEKISNFEKVMHDIVESQITYETGR
jgi:hypothetical protein